MVKQVFNSGNSVVVVGYNVQTVFTLAQTVVQTVVQGILGETQGVQVIVRGLARPAGNTIVLESLEVERKEANLMMETLVYSMLSSGL